MYRTLCATQGRSMTCALAGESACPLLCVSPSRICNRVGQAFSPGVFACPGLLQRPRSYKSAVLRSSLRMRKPAGTWKGTSSSAATAAYTGLSTARRFWALTCSSAHRGDTPMVHETIHGTFRQTNLSNESAEYLAKREELRLAEVELMRQRERVAELRRHLPQGAPIQDYVFEEGPRDLNGGDAPVRTVRLSELFTKPNRSLVIYHLMYGKRQTKACPMCTAWLDSANGVAHHLAQNLDFAVVAAPIFRLCAPMLVSGV